MLQPVLYVYLEDVAELHLQGAFALRLGAGCDFEKALRGVKVAIQENRGGLDMRRVDIYIVASAQGLPQVACRAGQAAKRVFAPDFATHYITMAVLLSQSSAGEDYAARLANNRRFLAAAEGWSGVANTIILLSDRNQRGEVSPANQRSCQQALAHLPLLPDISSFHLQMAAMAQAAGRMLFATAGFASREEAWEIKPILQKLANIIEESLNATAAPPELSAEKPENIAHHMISVAAKPLRRWQLIGHRLKDAETLLYGQACQGFYIENFAPHTPQAPAQITMPLVQLAQEEARLRQSIASLVTLTATLKSQLDDKKSAQIGLLKSVDDVKNRIGDYYAALHQHDIAAARLAAETAMYGLIHGYMATLQHTAAAIHALPTAKPAPTEEPAAPLNVPLLRDDGLIHERHVVGGRHILRLVGGFTLQDLWNAPELPQ